MKTVVLVCLIALMGFGAWKYDTGSGSGYEPVVRGVPTKARPAARKAKPKPTAVRPQGELAPKSVRKEIDRIAAQVEKVRGLELEKPVDARFLSRDDFAKRWKIDIQEAWSPSEREADENALIAFGFMSARSSLKKFAEQDAGDSIAGFYEHDTKNLFIIGDERDMDLLNRITMAHEITHAMQDQAFDLHRLFDKTEGNEDKQLALRALVEGDASLTETHYLGKQSYDEEELRSAAEEESLTFTSYEDAPPVFGLTFVFPYQAGTEWVKGLYDKGGWSAVNAAYKRPPQSTEQILHPEKYAQGDAPVDVKLPAVGGALGKGWKEQRTDTLGEYQTLILLAEGATDMSRLTASAAGWEGDRYSVYAEQKGDGVVLVWKTLWESDKDASEFTVGLAHQQQYLNGNVFGEEMKVKNGALSLDGADASIRIRHVGKEVSLVVARDTDTEVADRVIRRVVD